MLPKHYLSSCLVVCIYFDTDFEDADRLVLELGKEIFGSSDKGVRFAHLSYGKSGKGEASNHKYRSICECSNALTLGRCSAAQLDLVNSLRVGQFAFSGCSISIANNEGWDWVGESGVGGTNLVISFGPHEYGYFSPFTGDGIWRLLDIVSRYGRFCHGVIDSDYYIANKCGKYYMTANFPCLRSRVRSAAAWGVEGGEDRVRLVRDPREVLLVGAGISSALGFSAIEDVQGWMRSQGIASEDYSIYTNDRAEVSIGISDNVLDFQSTVRMSSSVRMRSRQLHQLFCNNNYSRKCYEVQYESNNICIDDLVV